MHLDLDELASKNRGSGAPVEVFLLGAQQDYYKGGH